ncbi:uncharacterized protein G2W53_044444 [Senna tora]|uniref:Uncharacterized protein n=1 Tax=Senna tora TaxID=362788 RepID=A0A834SDN7_9FABA|nr:uncharacterized protein G2W53_044444 [Senna tora]
MNSPTPFSLLLSQTSIALHSRPRLSPFDHEQTQNITFIPNSTIPDAFAWSWRKPSPLFCSFANLKFSLEAVAAALVKATLRTLPSLHWDLMAKLPTSEIASTKNEFRSRHLAMLAEVNVISIKCFGKIEGNKDSRDLVITRVRDAIMKVSSYS